MKSLGIDVGDRKGHVAVALDDVLSLTRLGSGLSEEDVAGVAIRLEPELVAIDSPPRPALAGKSRACERELARMGISSYSTPSDPEVIASNNFYGWIARGFRVFQSLQPHYPLFLAGEPVGHAIEIFPHASSYVLGGGPEPAKGKTSHRRALMERAGIDTRELRSGDEVDAALAAFTGVLALRGEFRAVGDPTEGVIVIPAAALAPGSAVTVPSAGPGELRVVIRGTPPVTWGGAGREVAWRQAMADAIRAARGDELAIPITSRVSVEAVFFVHPVRAWRMDLDNLAKPLLDTLFRPQYPQVKDISLTGALSEQDDGCVFNLTLSKQEVPEYSDEGLELMIKWTGESPSSLP